MSGICRGRTRKFISRQSQTKNYFLAEQYGYPALDYEEFIQKFADGMDYAQTVDLTDVLTLGSYYRTDIHWRQEGDSARGAAAGRGDGRGLDGQI